MTSANPTAAEGLAACPFCGAADAFVERATFSDCYVVCNDCSARGPVSCDENADDSDASENGQCEPGELPARRLWNRRPIPAGDDLVEAVARLEHVVDRDRYILAIALGHIRKALYGHRWLLEGRGPYEWDDDRYRDEFTDWLVNVEAALGPLAKLAWDKSDCTIDRDKVDAAREAARHYCVDAPKGHRSMLPSDLGLPCPSCAALTAIGPRAGEVEL